MKKSTSRILTTHTGSLPRPADLVEILEAKEGGKPVDNEAFATRVRLAVGEAVAKQASSGVDVLNDGEQGKIGYSTYVKDRLAGFGGASNSRLGPADTLDFPDWAIRRQTALRSRPSCNGPIAWRDFNAVQRDIDNLKAATATVKPEEVFMSAASPGVIALFLGNEYYPSHEAYVEALANVMRDEYNAIVKAGFVLQVDCPDLAMGRHIQFPDKTDREFLKIARTNVEALDHALRDIPPDRARVHLCWGNYEGPHHRDIPLASILPIVLKSKASAFSFEGANPRHEHEWAVFRDFQLPEGKLIIPGVLDSTTNFIEHPELVAQRIVRYAELVGRENVIAGSDCGFGTFASSTPIIAPSITWAKLQAMADGARIATRQLWDRRRPAASPPDSQRSGESPRARVASPSQAAKPSPRGTSSRAKTVAPRRTTRSAIQAKGALQRSPRGGKAPSRAAQRRARR
ncbi:MAG: epoxyalkane--coenzyme M transferase [SAR202 cluster bacterium]|nr:epoxyalkane--coenzyme M transferase [SAR202 cluster bacterium]